MSIDHIELLTEVSCRTPHLLNLSGYQISYYTHKIEDSDYLVNQDSLGVIATKKGLILAVADGLGGAKYGEIASKIAIETIQSKAIAEISSLDQVESIIIEAFYQANKKILDVGGGAATTLSLLFLHNGHYQSYHVGDSAVLIVSNRGNIKFKTILHSPVGYAEESGLLDNKVAIEHNQRHIISNYLGREAMHIEVSNKRKISARDTLLIASDGVLDNLYLSEIIEVIRKDSLSKASKLLVSMVRERMYGKLNSNLPSKPDDFTFILARKLGTNSKKN